MQIYFMRHGEAGFSAASDYDRELTQRGRRQVIEQAKRHCQEISAVDRVFSSPIIRARQTCDLMMETLDLEKVVTESSWLRHECSAAEAIDQLYQQLGDNFEGSVMLFSHQPLASSFLALLCDLEPAEVPMGTASLAKVSCSQAIAGFGKLEALHHAEL